MRLPALQSLQSLSQSIITAIRPALSPALRPALLGFACYGLAVIILPLIAELVTALLLLSGAALSVVGIVGGLRHMSTRAGKIAVAVSSISLVLLALPALT